MTFQPKKNTPWATIREEYETTAMSVRFLADRWCLHEKSIRTRRDKEGWNKQIGAITANLVTNAFARGEEQEEGAGHSAGQRPQDPHSPAGHEIGSENIDKPTTYNDPTPKRQEGGAGYENASPSPRQPAPPPLTPAPSIAERRELATQQRDREDAAAIRTAKSLATIHSDAIREQVAQADKLRATGEMMLDRIQAVLLTEDPEERKEAQRALLSINPDRDTLAGLTKAAQQLIEAGAVLKRRALGMDVVSKPGMGPGSGTAPVLSQPMEAVMREMPLEALMQLRNAAERISKLPAPKQPETIDGQATEEGGAVS